ncbi:hypothetical protein AV530_013147 [Patagioenas fasciata monilis]|uniref:Uncharacterized protein n=1 Tax=Patagioenas fasciata monilis TaxID=372326 RepID=A0A1V4JVX3_PATFA|nr:hypothetical protein AV530_013147 [Patagioenas fasciata monilis]
MFPKAGKDGIIDASRSPPAAWQPHGQSFVQSHFQAQYRSSLTCPHCLKQSNTFDPFLCISLPIPLRQTRVRAAAQRVPPAWSRVASGLGAVWLPR